MPPLTNVQDAYQQIKNLENTGQITLPEPQATVTVGSINASTGKFDWSVRTFTQSTLIPPAPGALKPTNTVIKTTVGLVQTNAVDLRLQFHVESPIANAPPLAATLAGHGLAEEPLKLETAAFAGTASGETIAGFPTVSSTATEITLDAGFACSVAAQTENVSPAVTAFNLTITVPGKAPVEVRIIIVRPPVLGMGAFTIPALPIALVYAPPQGKQNKNFASYTVTDTFTRTLTTAITSSTSTKTAQAYSAGDIIGKVAAVIASVAAIVGTGGTATGASAGVLGTLLTTLTGTGGTSSSSNSTASDLKTASTALDLLGDAVNSVGTNNETDGGTVSVESDHSITLQITDMSAYSTTPGQGPGVGDIFVYFSDVKVVWTAVNGDVGIHILGFGSIASVTAAALLQDQQSLSRGGTATTGLDAASIESLLSLDPFCVKQPLGGIAALHAPLVSPPRFSPATTPERSGEGTGGVFTETVDVTDEDKEVRTNTQTTITDAKPGWLSVLFGGDDTETTTTMTLTTAQTTDIKTDLKIANSVSLFSQDSTDPFDVMIFTDRSFGTYLYAEKGSSVLQGDLGILHGVGQLAERAGG
jgi:hypothetical protein